MKSAKATRIVKKRHLSDSAKAIISIVDGVRPVLQAHGGDVQFVSFRSGTVSLRFSGACSSCRQANATLMEIARRIKEKVSAAKRIRLT